MIATRKLQSRFQENYNFSSFKPFLFLRVLSNLHEIWQLAVLLIASLKREFKLLTIIKSMHSDRKFKVFNAEN